MRAFIALLIGLPLAAATVPRPAPEFAIQMPKGGQVLLSQHKGKVVILEFILTTCSHCQSASQLLSRLQGEYGPRGFQALGAAFNDMAHMLVPDFVRDFRINYPVGYSPREPIMSFLQVNPNEALHVPQMVIIDKKGVIRQQSLPRSDSVTHTEQNLRRMIETLLAEPGPGGAKRAAPKKTSAR